MELTESEKEDMRRILEGWYGVVNVDSWRMNAAVLGVLARVLTEIEACSRLMDFVPRPGTGAAHAVRRQLRSLARRAAAGDNAYLSCKNAGIWIYRREFDMAGRGL